MIWDKKCFFFVLFLQHLKQTPSFQTTKPWLLIYLFCLCNLNLHFTILDCAAAFQNTCFQAAGLPDQGRGIYYFFFSNQSAQTNHRWHQAYPLQPQARDDGGTATESNHSGDLTLLSLAPVKIDELRCSQEFVAENTATWANLVFFM